ncbi:Nuclear transcription factor Y subunit B-6 [Heracleum sosnowskyi]|uniref:Nuclear transcription factor Y subunit B-6 n=1 Tax=Heracleum sosnowskyi TaxID=360622 RepID=A0AAD8I733_9APIA|nr:Nuclear transcription factor Y subunit B-6 [Heracleum sosnowskyi]
MVREQDRYMPIANVIRLMRRIMPGHAKISDDAKETIQECVSEFISFITSEANMRCHQEHRKTITAEDVLWAMNNLGFDDYIEPLTFYLNRMREIESGERGPFRGDPLLRRSIEAGAMGVAPAFTPTYYMVPRSGIPGFMTMAQNAGSSTSGAGVNSLDRCSQWKQ